MIITKTPLRISFTGGGTDFPNFYNNHPEGGAVVSSTIDKYVYVILKKRFDKKIVVNWREHEMVDSVDEVQHELVRECLRTAGIKDSIEITTMADVPSNGSGLGSSSSLTVGLLNAMYTYKGERVNKQDLAEDACDVEINILGKPIGKQDQYAAAYGGLNYITFAKRLADVGIVHPIRPSKKVRDYIFSRLMLFYTGISRQASDILEEQNNNTSKNTGILNELRKDADTLGVMLGYSEFDTYINDNKDCGLGTMLTRSWDMKKKLASTISNPDIDRLLNLSTELGCEGGKIVGAGGGGFLLLDCPHHLQYSVRELLGLQELEFNYEPRGSRVIVDIE